MLDKKATSMHRILEQAELIIKKKDLKDASRKYEEYIDHFPDYNELNADQKISPIDGQPLDCISEIHTSSTPRTSTSTLYRYLLHL